MKSSQSCQSFDIFNADLEKLIKEGLSILDTLSLQIDTLAFLPSVKDLIECYNEIYKSFTYPQNNKAFWCQVDAYVYGLLSLITVNRNFSQDLSILVFINKLLDITQKCISLCNDTNNSDDNSATDKMKENKSLNDFL